MIVIKLSRMRFVLFGEIQKLLGGHILGGEGAYEVCISKMFRLT